MIEIKEPKLTEIALKEGSKASFVLEPLERGYGTTIGNCLRRILYTALPGAAVVGVRIEGVFHEFSTVPGVKEDVTEIVLNLKNVAVKVRGLDRFETQDAKLVRNVGGIVRAGDISVSGDAEIMNPDAYICSLEDGYSLDMTLTLGVGRGYLPASDNAIKEDAPAGYIPIDALFSPVVKAAYEVEPTRVKQDINFDKLTITVETNAASSPRDVISLAAKIMNDHMRLFINLVDGMSAKASIIKSDGEQGGESDMHPIEDLDLSVRPLNCLRRAGIMTIEALLAMTEEEMLNVRNLGKKSLEEVIQKLSDMGYSPRAKDE